MTCAAGERVRLLTAFVRLNVEDDDVVLGFGGGDAVLLSERLRRATVERDAPDGLRRRLRR